MRELTPAEKVEAIALRLRNIADTWPMHQRLLDKPFNPQEMFEEVGRYMNQFLEADIQALDDVAEFLKQVEGGKAVEDYTHQDSDLEFQRSAGFND